MAVKRIGNVNINYTVPEAQTQIWDALGRTTGEQQATGSNDNFFTKKWNSIENAVGTTLAAPASWAYDKSENIKTEQLLQDNKTRMNDIAKKYGYNTYHDVWDARDAAEASGDKTTLDLIDNVINPELKGQADINANLANEKAAAYDDYRKNNYVSQKINQDRGKFAGSALNTLSTMADVGLMAAGVPTGALFNAGQGALEGIADELEQNGEQNFSWDRAKQNALVGAASGAVTGALNKGLSNSLAQKGGKIFTGGNRLTQGINNFNSKGVGKVLSTVGSGAARGALSGAVGGATGAGVSSALQGADIGSGIANAFQGAVQGAKQGALTGGAMAGANMTFDATLNKVAPNIANSIRENQMRNASYGDTLREQFKGAWNSGDSGTAEFLKTVPDRVTNVAGAVKDAMSGTKEGFVANPLADNNKLQNGSVAGGVDDATRRKVAEAMAETAVKNPSDPVEWDNEVAKALQDLEGVNTKEQMGKILSGEGLAQEDIDAILNNSGNRTSNNENIKNAQFEMLQETNPMKDTYHTGIRSPEEINRLGDLVNNFDENEMFSYPDFTLKDAQNAVNSGKITVYSSKPIEAGTFITPSKMMAQDYAGSTGEVYSKTIPIDDFAAISSGDEGNYLPISKGVLAKNTNNELPETKVYRTLTGDTGSQWDNLAQESGYATYDDAIRAFAKANPNAEVNAGAVLTWLDNNPGEWNPNSPRPTVEQQEVPTSKQIKAKREIVEDITNQFNPVDQPTARSTKPNETFYKIYDEWGLSDGDDIRQAVSYAEPGALVPQMIREAAGEAGVIDLSDAEGLIVDLKINKKNYDKYVNALEDIMDSTDTTIIGGKQGVDALELQRTLERMASDARGTNGTYHIGNTVVDETMARNFQRIANEIGDKLDEAAVSKGVVQNVLNRHSGDIQQMRNAFQNDTWQSAVDSKISGAKTIRDLRSSIRDLTRANIFINNGDERYSTFGGRFAAKSNTIPTSKSGIENRLVNEAYDKLKNSSMARNARLEKNAKIVRGETTTTPKLTATNTATTTSTYTPATKLYNAIGRTEGLNNAEQARTAEYLANAVQNVPKAPNAGAVTLEDLATPTSTGTTSVYNSLYGTESSSPSNSGYFQATGDYWTDTLGKAMSAAIDADDVEAFGALYGMYQDALANLQKTSSSETKLTDKQRQANAAALALDDFEMAEPNAAYDVSDIPVIGAIANLGGNEYASKAEALALQLGYMLSGATVNREEAKNIGMAYVPQPRDNAAVRQSKLNQIRGIISEYQKTYAD